MRWGLLLWGSVVLFGCGQTPSATSAPAPSEKPWRVESIEDHGDAISVVMGSPDWRRARVDKATGQLLSIEKEDTTPESPRLQTARSVYWVEVDRWPATICAQSGDDAPRKLAELDGSIQSLDMAPGGELLVAQVGFNYRADDGESQFPYAYLAVLSLDGSSPARIIPQPDSPYGIWFSPDNNFWLVNHGKLYTEMSVVDPNTGISHQIDRPTHLISYEATPEWVIVPNSLGHLILREQFFELQTDDRLHFCTPDAKPYLTLHSSEIDPRTSAGRLRLIEVVEEARLRRAVGSE